MLPLGSAHVIKLRTLRWGDFPGLCDGPSVITKVSQRDETEAEVRVMWGPEQKKADSF